MTQEQLHSTVTQTYILQKLQIKEEILNFAQYCLMNQLHKIEVHDSYAAFCSFDVGWQRGKLYKVRLPAVHTIEIKECAQCMQMNRISDLAVIFIRLQ